MAYVKHNFRDGEVLMAVELNEMENQIAINEANIANKVDVDDLESAVEEAIQDAIDSGEISGGVGGGVATIKVGTVTTLTPGNNATVVNSGTDTNVVLDFGIPRGADGSGGGSSTVDLTEAKAYADEKVAEHADNTSNPHNVTLEQLGVTATAEELNAAGTMQTQINTLSALVGDTSVEDQIAAKLDGAGSGVQAVMTSGDGYVYFATVPGIDTLEAGVSFIMIPNVTSATTSPTLNVNSLGAKNIRRALSTTLSEGQVGPIATWLTEYYPYKVTYDGVRNWIVESLTKPAASDLEGVVAIQNGGTQATDAAGALANLGAAAVDHTHSQLEFIDQDVKTTASPTFDVVTANKVIGAVYV